MAHVPTPIERFWLCQEYRALASTAVRMRHKHAVKLAATRPEELTGEVLAATVLRLKGWIAEQPELPVDPDSVLARERREQGA